MPTILNEHQQWMDTSGKPLVGGRAYFGIQNADPKVSPQTIYSDRGFTIPIANPQTLDSNGRTANKVWIRERYSIVVDDLNATQQYQELDNGEPSDIGITPLDNVAGANDITATASPTISSYLDKQTYVLKTVSVNTGPVRWNIDSVGFVDVVKHSDNQQLEGGEFAANQIITAIYNATSNVLAWSNRDPIIIVELPAGYQNGQTTAPGVDTDNDKTVFPGEVRDAVDVADIDLTTAFTKQLDAPWVAGTDQGGLASNLTPAVDTTYHLFSIIVGGVADAGFDTDIDAANLISEHAVTSYRRRASYKTLVGAATFPVVRQTQGGNFFVLDVPDPTLSSLDPGTAGVLTVTPLPTGFNPDAYVRLGVEDTSPASGIVYLLGTSPDQTDTVPTETISDERTETGAQAGRVIKRIPTDTSAQIRTRVNLSNAEVKVEIMTIGWYDDRLV